MVDPVVASHDHAPVGIPSLRKPSMTEAAPGPRRAVPIYYGWVVVGVAALAMTATLPGRTHGLGLITEPLIADLNIDRPLFAQINLVTCLLGATFCLPIGSLLDRFGARVVLTWVVVG